MRRVVPLLVYLLVGLLACGRPGSSENVVAKREDGGPTRANDAGVALPPLALGMPELARFAYRTRTGHAAFRLARDSEAAGDWATVATRCREALAADPDHLDAAYLHAVALAKTGASPEQILAPLQKAVAGDYAKWGAASLEQPALQPFLATALGQAWKQRVEAEHTTFAAALARSLIVTAEHDLYAFDAETSRWYRLTRSGSAMIAALHVRSQHQLAYVTRERKLGGGKRTKMGVGIVDLATGRTRRAIELPVDVPKATALTIGYTTQKQPGFVVRVGKATWRLVDRGALAFEAVPATAQVYTPAYLADMVKLEVKGRKARIARPAVERVIADWDDKMLASAIKIGGSKKVVTVPSPGLIDGDTATWSADKTQLAFVAQLSDTCEPAVATAAGFVADGATGNVRELERAVGGIAIEWYGERKLAIAGDHGVSIVALDGSAPVVLAGADGLVTPRRKPKCSPEPVLDEPTIDDDDGSPTEAAASPARRDAGIAH